MGLMRLKISPKQSKVLFEVKKLGFLTIKGGLSELKGSINFDPDDLNNSSFDIAVSTSTIDTNNKQRDEHLRNKDFFNVTEHPVIAFISNAISASNGHYTVKGNLSLLQTTMEIQIPFTLKDGVFSGAFSLNRLDYHLGSKFPAFFIGKTVQVFIHCETER